MKLSKDTEVEIRQLYQTYWDAYLSGDFDTFASFLDDDIVIYGTAVGEIFSTKEEALAFYTATAEEMTGKAEFRNREISIHPVGDTIVIYEQSQLYILIEGTWTYYGFARITGIFEQKENGWKLVHQHGSFPDSRTEEGQQIASEKIKEENLQLRDAVKRRTVELENKTRELEIESSLERVRAVAMGMRQPNDMLQVCQVISEQLQLLGIKEIRNVQTAVIAESGEASYMNYQYFAQYREGIIEKVEIAKHPKVKDMITRMQQSPDAYFNHSFEGAALEEWKQYRKDDNQFPDPILDAASEVHFYFYSIGQGGLGLSAYSTLTEDDINVFHRLRNVFALAYQRFRDIEQAEAQTREAQIEASLDRVRANAMGLRKSEELENIISVIFEELQKLGLELYECSIFLRNGNTREFTVWSKGNSDAAFLTHYQFLFVDHPILNEVLRDLENNVPYRGFSLGELEIQSYANQIFSQTNLKDASAEYKESFSALQRVFVGQALFQYGLLEAVGTEPLPGDLPDVLQRFTQVIELTYTRFLDLQNAESQTHKVKIEVALERVRARALAMQEPEELIEVAQVMRHEMGLLGIEELETSSIYIHDEGSDIADCWYAIKDIRVPEKKLVADHITIELHKSWVGREMLKFYNSSHQQTSIIMQGANRIEWINYCSGISDVLEDFYGEVIPDRTYHLYKFSNGAIGAAAEGDISEESWELLRRATSVFSLAYSRFKDLTQARMDLQKLKTEKQRAEDALAHLKDAQTQLIQSEKMASLGELTAGIAHEIQNPLNFVNNFSELNTELIEEMKHELRSGNTGEAIALADDIAENEQKINHHGKRADAIVKGMLQHSSSGSGTKEPTDINALADEYLRLAYHGLRAKDNTFNATMKTEFDPAIGLVNIIPQDIGRVILNLITNAFYAVSAKAADSNTSKQENPASADAVSTFAPKSPKGDLSYVPTVTIRTLLSKSPLGDLGAKRDTGDLWAKRVEIAVSDNGPGIPQPILDKIFQPFFTTKPTGQGTGLGLSLSYDIVKAHGGELTVETKEGEGSVFIIQLPVSWS